MKILILTKSFEREVTAFVRYATTVASGLHFRVVMPDSSHTPLPVPLSRRRLYWAQHMRAAWFSPALLQDFKVFRPDIVHIFEEYSSLIAFQAVILRNMYCPESSIMVYAAENIPGNVGVFFRLPARYVMRRAHLAFVCSHGVKQVLVEEGWTLPIEVFPLGVDISAFQKCDASQLKHDLGLDGKFIIGYVGRLLTIKGIFDLLEMMRRLPENAHLLMVGGGPEEAEFRRRMADYELTDCVHVLGDVPYAELPHYINCMDIGVVPSHTTPRWKEQFGRVLIELMSCEVPVIGSDSGSIPEVLGEAGAIFPEDHIDALVSLVQQLMAQPATRQDFGQRGRTRVEKLYALSVMYQQFFAMYKRLSTV